MPSDVLVQPILLISQHRCVCDVLSLLHVVTNKAGSFAQLCSCYDASLLFALALDVMCAAPCLVNGHVNNGAPVLGHGLQD